MKQKAERIIEEYEMCSKKIYDEAMYGTHNNRIINREQKKTTKLFHEFCQDEELRKICIEALWESENA